MDANALDRWITGGRYRSEQLRATCEKCGESSAVLAESEYGATTWTPEECPACGTPWSEDTPWADDEPPEPDPYEARGYA